MSETDDAWRQRVIEEKAQLDGRIHRLIVWLADERDICKLANPERDYLHQQLVVMESYSDILARRIRRFQR